MRIAILSIVAVAVAVAGAGAGAALGVTACGDVAPVDTPGSSAEADSSTGSRPGEDKAASVSEGEDVPISGLTKVVVGVGFCGGAPGTCNGRVMYAVDLVKSSLEIVSCVDTDAGDATITRAVDAAQLAKIGSALANLRFKRSAVEFQDGRMEYLYLSDTSGETRRYSPGAACGGDYDKIVSGFEPLRAAITGE